jgi:vacuolar-type H+-ATPase subunit I/STV1
MAGVQGGGEGASTGSINVNENTATAVEPISKTGGDTAVDFDQLETLMERGRKPKEAPTGEEPDAEADEGADDPEEGELDSTELAKKAQAQKDKAAGKVKTIKVQVGDQMVDLRADGTLQVPIGGKLEKVSVQELLTNYSGKTDWTRKYTELDTERKAYQANVKEVDGAINQLTQLATAGKGREAIEYLYEILGADPRKGWADFKKSIQESTEKLQNLTPEERKAAEFEDELGYYKRKDEERSKQTETQKLRSAVETRTNTVLQKTGMQKADFAELVQDMRATGRFPEDKLTPELVGEYYLAIKYTQGANKVLEEIAPEIENRESAIGDLRDIWKQNPGFTEDDIRQIASEVYGKRAARNLSRKVKKADPARAGKSVPLRTPKKEYVTFDDLE